MKFTLANVMSESAQFMRGLIVNQQPNGSNGNYPVIHGGGDLIERWGGDDEDSAFPQFPPNLRYDVLQLVKKYTWAEYVDGARHIFATYPVVSGAIKEKANTCIGDAWEPVFEGANKEWGKRARQWLLDWMEICDIRGQPFNWMMDLAIASQNLDHSGDMLFNLRTNSDDFPLLQPIEAHRIGNREPNGIIMDGEYKGMKIVNGIVYDGDARTVAYKILGDTYTQDQYLPAGSVVFIFDPVWFSQGRGIPSIAWGMNDWEDTKTIKDNEKRAQDILSRLTLIETNATGRPDPGSSRVMRRPNVEGTSPTEQVQNRGKSMFVERFERGLIRYLKARTGSGIETMKAERPSAGSLNHYELVLRGAFIGMEWPIEWAYDLKTLGGALARAMTYKINQSVNKRQNVLYPHAKFMAVWALSHGIARNDLPFDIDWFKWSFSMPGDATVDDGNDAESDRRDIDRCIQSITGVLRKKGTTLEKVATEKFNDIKFIKALIGDETPVTMAEMRLITPNASSVAEDTTTTKEKKPGEELSAGGEK